MKIQFFLKNIIISYLSLIISVFFIIYNTILIVGYIYSWGEISYFDFFSLISYMFIMWSLIWVGLLRCNKENNAKYFIFLPIVLSISVIMYMLMWSAWGIVYASLLYLLLMFFGFFIVSHIFDFIKNKYIDE